jgi:hypothetical protein
MTGIMTVLNSRPFPHADSAAMSLESGDGVTLENRARPPSANVHDAGPALTWSLRDDLQSEMLPARLSRRGRRLE